MSNSIEIAVKIRPLIKREVEKNLPVQWEIKGDSIEAVDKEIREGEDGRFTFDHIFNMDATNKDVFDSVVRPIVNKVVDGYYGIILTCGEKGSGKTHTMLGPELQTGIIPIAIKYMFDAIAKYMDRHHRTFSLWISHYEVGEFEPSSEVTLDPKAYLEVTEVANGEISVDSKEETCIENCIKNVLSILYKGKKESKKLLNKCKRSHMIFQIKMMSEMIIPGGKNLFTQWSELNMVELAGLETENPRNYSLSVLALVIGVPQKFPECADFSDNELTQLLQFCASCCPLTAIIYTITPAALRETQYTLSLALKTRNIMKNKFRPIAPEVSKEISEEQTKAKLMSMEPLESGIASDDHVNTLSMLTESLAPEIESDNDLEICDTEKIFKEQIANNAEPMLTKSPVPKSPKSVKYYFDLFANVRLRRMDDKSLPLDLDAKLVLAKMQDEEFDTFEIKVVASYLKKLLHLLRKSSQNETLTDKNEKDLPNGVPSTSNDISSISNEDISKDIIEEIQHLVLPSEIIADIMKYKSPRELFKKFVELTTKDKECERIIAICEYWRTGFFDAKRKLWVKKKEYMKAMKRKHEETKSQSKALCDKIIQLDKDLSQQKTECDNMLRSMAKMRDALQKNADENRKVWEDKISIEKSLSIVLAELKRHKIDTGVQDIYRYRKIILSDILNYDKKEVATQLEIKKRELDEKTQEAEKYLTQSKKLNNEYSSDKDEPSKRIWFDEQTKLLSDYEMCRKEINVLQYEIHKLEIRYQQFQYECLKGETEPSGSKKFRDMFDEMNKLLREKIEYFKHSEIGNKE